MKRLKFYLVVLVVFLIVFLFLISKKNTVSNNSLIMSFSHEPYELNVYFDQERDGIIHELTKKTFFGIGSRTIEEGVQGEVAKTIKVKGYTYTSVKISSQETFYFFGKIDPAISALEILIDGQEIQAEVNEKTNVWSANFTPEGGELKVIILAFKGSEVFSKTEHTLE